MLRGGEGRRLSPTRQLSGHVACGQAWQVCWALSHLAGFLFPSQGRRATFWVTRRPACSISPGNVEPQRGSGEPAQFPEPRWLELPQEVGASWLCGPARPLQMQPLPLPSCTCSFVLNNPWRCRARSSEGAQAPAEAKCPSLAHCGLSGGGGFSMNSRAQEGIQPGSRTPRPEAGDTPAQAPAPGGLAPSSSHQ